MQDKKKVKLREQKELLNKIDQAPISTKKGKVRKTPSEEICEEFERKLEDLSPLEDEVVKPLKKKVTVKKSVLKKQFDKRREEKEKKKGP